MTNQDASDMTQHTMMMGCDLYPTISDAAYLPEALPHLAAIASHQHVTAMRLCLSSPVESAIFAALTDLLYRHDVALIVAPTQNVSLDTLPLDQIDGVHVSHAVDLKNIPTTYRKKSLSLQTGCSCSTLDEAMRAGELGADYVAFPATETVSISQWSLVTELPCVADAISSLEQAQQARLAGADFLGFTLKLDGTDQETIATLDALLS